MPWTYHLDFSFADMQTDGCGGRGPHHLLSGILSHLDPIVWESQIKPGVDLLDFPYEGGTPRLRRPSSSTHILYSEITCLAKPRMWTEICSADSSSRTAFVYGLCSLRYTA